MTVSGTRTCTMAVVPNVHIGGASLNCFGYKCSACGGEFVYVQEKCPKCGALVVDDRNWKRTR